MLLQVVVARDCLGCEEAISIANEAAARFPKFTVEVIDISQDGVKSPKEVFAVPTYLLNGRILYLGNPNRLELFERLGEKLEEAR